MSEFIFYFITSIIAINTCPNKVIKA